MAKPRLECRSYDFKPLNLSTIKERERERDPKKMRREGKRERVEDIESEDDTEVWRDETHGERQMEKYREQRDGETVTKKQTELHTKGGRDLDSERPRQQGREKGAEGGRGGHRERE